jgi:nucleotide-binding universal stress UspA family protein
MKTIVLPVDFSSASRRQIQFVAALNLKPGDHLQFVHCHTDHPDYMGGGEPSDGYSAEERKHHMDQLLQEAVVLIPHQSIQRSGHECVGQTAKSLLQFINDQNADLVVLGSHGHGALYGMMFGSVTKNLIHAGVCPILVIPSNPAEALPTKLDNILVPIDLSPHTHQLIDYAAAFAEDGFAHVHLLHVVGTPTAMVEGIAAEWAPAEIQYQKTEAARQLLTDEIESRDWETHVTTHVEVGLPVLGILNKRKELNSDLTIIGSHGHGAIYRMLIGSVVQKLLHHESGPLLIFPMG